LRIRLPEPVVDGSGKGRDEKDTFSVMRSGFGNSRGGRTLLLKVILLGVLLGSVGLGWVLVRRARTLGERGAEVLYQIRRRKLDYFWGSESVNLLFLRFAPDGRPVGWRQTTREQTDEGYLGTQTVFERGKITREIWGLDTSASDGEYECTSGGVMLTTTIRLSDGKVSVAQGPRRPVTAKAPTNYVPEGLSSLVFLLAAKGGQKATCRMIFNERAIDPAGVNFTTVHLVPRGPDVLEVSYPGGASQVHRFDGRGLLQEMEMPEVKVTERRVSREEVRRHFPRSLEQFSL